MVRTGLGAGYLSRRNAIDMVMYAGDHARARFGSWKEYGTSVLLGRAIWGGVDDPSGMFEERAKIVKMLLNDPRSTWVTAEWWPPIESADEADEDDPEEGPAPGATLH